MNKPLSESDLATPKVTTGPIAGSRKIYAAPDAAPDLRVPLREIPLTEGSGEEPVRVYDPSGIYTDADAAIDVEKGLKRARIAWVKERGGVEEYDGRPIKPVDNGNVTGKHLARNFPNTPKPLRALSAQPDHPARMGAQGRHHQGNDLHRRARKSRPQDNARRRAGTRTTTARASALRCRSSSRRNSSARRLRAAARSSRPTSITANSSR